jgi:tubulin polyglutamylase complex subunit 2
VTLLPHFDESSRNFELDNCNGYGKVCLVYRNSKPGIMCSDQSAEIWFLDRSFQWHFLTSSFKNYYRLLIAHLGLPQWQTLFTEDGLPPFLEVI